MNLTEFRTKYPQYKDVADQKLADALYKKYYPNADRREFDARIGLKPYQSEPEGFLKTVQNLPASIAESKYLVSQMGADAVRDFIDPRQQFGNTPPLEVTPGAPVEQLLDQPAGVTVDMPGTGGRLLPEGIRQAVGKGAAEQSVAAQLRQMEARKQIAANPVDMKPGFGADVAQGLASAVEMVPPAIASMVVRNPAPLVAYFTMRSGGQGYGEAMKAGAGTDTARAAAGLYAAAEAVTEAVAGKVFVEGGKTLIRSVLKSAAVEGLTEGVTEAIQALVDSQVIGEDMTLEQALDRIKSASVGGAVAGAPVAALTHVMRGGGREATPGINVNDPVSPPTPAAIADAPIEERTALPAPGVMLALPPPEAFAPPPSARRQPAAPAEPEGIAPARDETDYAARIALQKSRQAETKELLQTARETITPLGTFTTEEIGGEAAQRVNALRIRTGRPLEAPFTVEELARAKVPQTQIDAVIAARKPRSNAEALTALDITRAAAAKNIIADDTNFGELAYRTVGARDPKRMTQAQLGALKDTLDAMPAHPAPVTVPIADTPAFTEDQYGKSLDALRRQGRYTAQAIKDATGLKSNKDVAAVRDAMVRRGQLVQRSPSDFRLYDTLGEERQTTPDDLPPGAFKEYVVRRVPVSKLRLRRDGKLLPDSHGSGSEVRARVSQIRAEEAKAGKPMSALAIEPAEDVAHGVMENRYDEAGNLIGQVVVDTHRDAADAAKAAERLNNPDVGARYTATPVAPTLTAEPAAPVRKPPPPEALAGRTREVLQRLNKLAKERNLPLIGTRVTIKPEVLAADGSNVEGMYLRNLISIAATRLTPGMTTDEVVDQLAQVMDHETIHALRKAGVLGPETDGWKTIVRYTRRAKQPGTSETYMERARRIYTGVPGYNTEADLEEEAIAEAFRHWAANRRNVVGKPATVFSQIVEWFKRLFRSIPDDVFSAIETGQMVADALTPPGSAEPRARATRSMESAAAGVSAAQAAKDENLVRVRSREYLRARAQAREDRYGRSGPKTVLGTTPSKAYATGEVGDRDFVAGVVDRYKTANGVTASRLMTLLPEPVEYLKKIADAQQRAAHSPKANDVAKAYRALVDETKAMFKSFGPLEISAWTGDGAPYASPAEMLADIAAGKLRMRLSDEMFGPGADNPGHPFNAVSGYRTVDGKDLTVNDIFRVVHDVYGHGQSGFRDDPRGAYNAYHEHALLLSPEARRALATETLAQRAWQDYGAHLRRADGTVPRPSDVDYLDPKFREFAQQKAFAFDDESLAADPGFALVEAAAVAEPLEDAAKLSIPDPRESLAAYRARGATGENFSDLANTAYAAPLLDAIQGKTFAQAKSAADDWVLSAGRASGREHIVLFDQDGAAAAIGAGKHNVVGLPEFLDRPMERGEISYATHNHPLNSGLSPADIAFVLLGSGGRGAFTLSALGHKDARSTAKAGIVFADRSYERDDFDALRALMTQLKEPLRAALQRTVNARVISPGTATSIEAFLYNALLHRVGVIELASNGPQVVQRLAPTLPNLVDEVEQETRDAIRRAGYEFEYRGNTDSGGAFEEGRAGARTSDAERAAGGTGSEGSDLSKASGRSVVGGVSLADIRVARYSKFDDNLPGGRLYGNPNRSPGGALSKPGTPTPSFTNPRPGNQYFGGELAEHQLQMARAGERGAALIYLSPEEFLALANIAPRTSLRGIVRDIDAGALTRLTREQHRAINRAVDTEDWEIADLPISRLVATQDEVNSDFAAALSKRPEDGDKRYPLVIRINGANYIRDGHHRVAAASVGPTVRVRLVDTGAAPSDARQLTLNVNPEQEVYNAAVTEGYKFSGLPSLVLDGYAGNVRAVEADGAFSARALAGRTDSIPVMLYPKRAEGIGLITALEAQDGSRVPFPRDGLQEFVPDNREDGGPKYSLNAPFGTRVPAEEPGPMFNILQQRTEGWVGRAVNAIGRSKQHIPVLGTIGERLGIGGNVFDARVKLQDKMLSIKEMIENIKEDGGNITDLNDTYMLEQLYHGKVFDQIEAREYHLQIPLLEALKAAHDGPNKVTPADLEDYLYALHAPERNAYLRARGSKLESPSGMSDAEAGSILDQLALAGKLPELEALEGMVRAVTADTTATRIAGGLISPDTESPYQHYVPLKGFDEEDLDPGNPTENQTRARSGRGFTVGGREDRSTTGRSRKAGNIIGHLFLQNTEAVIRAQKNEVALSFMRLLQENAEAGYGQILTTAPTRKVVGPNGMIHEAGDPSYRQAPDIVTAKYKGKEIVARVADPRLARAIKSDYVTTSNDIVNGLVNIAGTLNRYLATVNTSLNPEFLISNIARDLQTAGILSQQYDIPKLGRQVIGNAPKAMAGIREVLRDGTANSDWARAFVELQEAGGTTEFLGIHDLETQIKRIRKNITATGLSVTGRKVRDYLMSVAGFINDYNKVAENAFRLSAYRAARGAGVSIPQAAYLAKNLTINFNKGGELKTFMNAMYLFYNASTQGTAVLMNGLKSKRVQKIVAGVVVAGVLQDILNRAISGDDDDNGVTDYDDIPDYVLETNFILMDPLGVLKSVGVDKGYFSLPMPYGFNAFYNLGRNMSAGFSGSPVRNPASSAVDSMMTFLSAFNPLGGVQSILNFIFPTFADPIIDLATNKDYSGKDIVPERPSFGLPVPNSQKYWANTDHIPVDVAAWINAATGGNEVRPGAVDISPETMQYAIDYATGSLGKFAQRLWKLGTDTGPKALQGDFADIEIGDIPFARRVVGSIGQRGATERYYTVAKEVKTVAAEMKLYEDRGDVAAMREKLRTEPVEVKLIPAFDDGEKALQDLRKQLREVREAKGLPPVKRRAAELQIKLQQDLLMARLTQLYFTMKKAAP